MPAAKEIGISHQMKDVLNMIDEGLSPIVKYKEHYYVLESEGRDLGSMYYTRFDTIGVAEYSVQMPFSYADRLGQVLHKGDNLRSHHEPRVTELPPLLLAGIYNHMNNDMNL